MGYLTLTGRKGHMSIPGKGRGGHIYPTIVMSWWHHFDVA